MEDLNKAMQTVKKNANAMVEQLGELGTMGKGLGTMAGQAGEAALGAIENRVGVKTGVATGGRRRRRTMKHKRSAKRRRHSGPAYGGKRKRRSTRRRRNH